MLRYIKWAFVIAVVAVVGSVLHYTLPQRDIVYITNAYNRVVQFGENSIFWASPDVGSNTEAGTVSRDVLFIETVRANGREMVYRNEDTGWIWPPYFKFNSSNVQAQASRLTSTEAAPRWVAITHYGWRMPFLSAFPNAVSIREVAGPDVRLIPWFNIAFLLFLLALVWGVTVRVRRFAARRIAPTIDSIDSAIDDRRAGISRWLGTWRRKPRP